MPDQNPKHITPDAEFEPTAGERLTLFDEGGYTVVSGVLKGNQEKRLLQRCEGHPMVAGCPTGWHIVPEFLEIPLLHALLDRLNKNPNGQTITAGKDRRELVFEEMKYFHGLRREAAR